MWCAPTVFHVAGSLGREDSFGTVLAQHINDGGRSMATPLPRTYNLRVHVAIAGRLTHAPATLKTMRRRLKGKQSALVASVPKPIFGIARGTQAYFQQGLDHAAHEAVRLFSSACLWQ